jgi:hypothetical protein
MSDDRNPSDKRSLKPALFGACALLAWFVLLWLMFGEVL